MEFEKNVKQDNEKEVITYPKLCKSCGLCIANCPQKAMSFDKNNLNDVGDPAVDVDLKKCIACKQCEMICPDCAIKIRRK